MERLLLVFVAVVLGLNLVPLYADSQGTVTATVTPAVVSLFLEPKNVAYGPLGLDATGTPPTGQDCTGNPETTSSPAFLASNTGGFVEKFFIRGRDSRVAAGEINAGAKGWNLEDATRTPTLSTNQHHHRFFAGPRLSNSCGTFVILKSDHPDGAQKAQLLDGKVTTTDSPVHVYLHLDMPPGLSGQNRARPQELLVIVTAVIK